MYNANKIVIFDWGGVIESHREGEYSLNTAITNFIKHFNNKVNENNLIERYFDVCTRKVEEGNKEDIWFEKIRNEFNIQCSEDEFYKFYEEEFNRIEYYKDVVEYAHSLKAKCKIGILSNLGKVDIARLDKQVDLKVFDYVWLSCELKCSKPNEKIYKIVEKDCNIIPNNILFIFEPVKTFKGKCIAVIHRLNDNDDKLILTSEGKDYSDDAIRALTEFQERFFKSIIIRKP